MRRYCDSYVRKQNSVQKYYVYAREIKAEISKKTKDGCPGLKKKLYLYREVEYMQICLLISFRKRARE